VRSGDEVRTLLEGAGLRVEHLSAGPMAAAGGAALNVPTIPGTADYVRVVALRP
jgi:hypothetical protein